ESAVREVPLQRGNHVRPTGRALEASRGTERRRRDRGAGVGGTDHVVTAGVGDVDRGLERDAQNQAAAEVVRVADLLDTERAERHGCAVMQQFGLTNEAAEQRLRLTHEDRAQRAEGLAETEQVAAWATASRGRTSATGEVGFDVGPQLTPVRRRPR